MQISPNKPEYFVDLSAWGDIGAKHIHFSLRQNF